MNIIHRNSKDPRQKTYKKYITQPPDVHSYPDERAVAVDSASPSISAVGDRSLPWIDDSTGGPSQRNSTSVPSRSSSGHPHSRGEAAASAVALEFLL